MRGQSVSSGRAGSGVAGGDFGLQDDRGRGWCSGLYGSRSMAASPRRMRSWSHWAAVLIEEEDWFAGGGDAGAGAGGLDLHQGYEAVDFWFGGSEFGEDAAEAERVFAEGGAQQSSPAVAE